MLPHSLPPRNHAAIKVAARSSSPEIFGILMSVTTAAQDAYTGAHTSRIGLYSKKIAEVMNMNEDFIEKIAVASSLHDIGKICISDNILLKRSSLTRDEFTIMKEHTTIGSKILTDSPNPTIQMANSIALNHHEKWRGEGYPRGLQMQEIPIEARIVKLVDEYDALRSERPYKRSMTHQETLRVLTEGDGRSMPDHFDPEVLSAFLEAAPYLDDIFNAHQNAKHLVA